MFQCLTYSITFNESKEKFRIVFCCFSAIKNFDTALSSSSFPIKLVDLEIITFVCLDKSIPVSLFLIVQII